MRTFEIEETIERQLIGLNGLRYRNKKSLGCHRNNKR